jgi:hypothetical protein
MGAPVSGDRAFILSGWFKVQRATLPMRSTVNRSSVFIKMLLKPERDLCVLTAARYAPRLKPFFVRGSFKEGPTPPNVA